MPGYSSHLDTGLHAETKNIDSWILEFDYEWREGSRDRAVEIAKAYIEARRAQLEPILGAYTLEQLVTEVECLRNDKRYEDRIIVDMWLHSEYGPRQITGEANVTVKIPYFRGESNGNLRDKWQVG